MNKPANPLNTQEKWPSRLHALIAYELDDVWALAVDRISTHPNEIVMSGPHRQTALHVACYRYPPEHVIEKMIHACPESVSLQNKDGETPLHLAIDSSSEKVQLMLIIADKSAVSMQDVQGDTPMHLACMSNSSMTVLRKMVEASPEAVNLPNKNGFTPFMVISRILKGVTCLSDITGEGEYVDVWEKTEMFVKMAHFGSLHVRKGCRTNILHAAVGGKCPREIVRVAIQCFPEQLSLRDNKGRLPLSIAAACDEYIEPDSSCKVMEIFSDDEDASYSNNFPLQKEKSLVHVLVDIFPQAASMANANGRFPLAYFVENGKVWDKGLISLIQAAPVSLYTHDTKTKLYPFMLAAVGENSDITTVYHLLRTLPQLVQSNFDCEKTSKICSNDKKARCLEGADQDCHSENKAEKSQECRARNITKGNNNDFEYGMKSKKPRFS